MIENIKQFNFFGCRSETDHIKLVKLSRYKYVNKIVLQRIINNYDVWNIV